MRNDARSSILVALVGGLMAGGLMVDEPVLAATFVVDTTVDAVDATPGDHECRTAADSCSLRAAVQEANLTPGLDEITMPAGTFTLTLGGFGEDAAATGDLDVSDDVTLTGAGEASTIIDGGGLDRVFDSHPGATAITLWLITLTVRNGVVTGPPSSDGGCFRNPLDGQLLLDRVTVRDCVSKRMGGAIYNAGRFEGVEVLLANNGDPEVETGSGGAVANVGPTAQVFLLQSELRGNHAQNAGAIYTSAEFVMPNTSEVRLEHCSLIGNEARQNGGAILNNSRTHVYVEDSTISGNSAGSGGGLFNDGGGLFLIRNSTITLNHAEGIGGGISEVHFDPQFIVSRNSIIAGNTADSIGPDCNFRMRSEGGTLLGNTTGCDMTAGPGDLLNVDPQLRPLANHGRRIWAHLLRHGSPAIDTGANSFCTPTDQRGIRRPLDGTFDTVAICDIGAIEYMGELFASGFETGNTSEWSTATP